MNNRRGQVIRLGLTEKCKKKGGILQILDNLKKNPAPTSRCSIDIGIDRQNIKNNHGKSTFQCIFGHFFDFYIPVFRR